jgi:hypothetical protein
METLTKINSLGKESSNQGVINNFHDLIICKVKFCAFSEYENICFLPNYFDELVRIFSKAFYPNDFSVIFLDSLYQQHSIHSDETYNDFLEQINNSEEEINAIKFQIILHSVNNNNEDFNKKEKIAHINKIIKSIYEHEIRHYMEIMKMKIYNSNLLNVNINDNKNNINNNNQNSYSSSISKSFDENNNNNNNNNLIKIRSFNSNSNSNLNISFNNNNNYYLKSPTSNSCKGFENKKIESFKLVKNDFSFIDSIYIECLSDCGFSNINEKTKINLDSRIFKGLKGNGKNHSVNGNEKEGSNNNTNNTKTNTNPDTNTNTNRKNNYKKNDEVQCC